MLDRRHFISLSLTTGAALALSMRGTAMAQGRTTARLRIDIDPDGLYSVQTISLIVGNFLGGFILERLVYLDETGAPQPWLAESWKYSEDGKVITFRLKPGKTFHDGEPLNAEAVKFQFDEILDPNKGSPAKGFIGPLERVEMVDDMTVDFIFTEAFAPFMSLVGTAFFGFNSPKAVKEAGDSYGRFPIGTGPYMFKEWIPGSELTIVRYPEFKQFRPDAVNQGPAYLESVTFPVILEEGVVTSAMMTGEIDAASLTADAMAPLAQDPQFEVITDLNAKNLMFLEFNYLKPPFDDRALREALSYAIDREAVLAAAFGGNGKIALSPLSRGIPGFDEAVAGEHGSPYNPDKAKELLEAAGWTGDGTRSKDGMPAKFSIRSYSDSTTERALAVIQANLADIGFEVEVSTAEWGTFYPSLLKGDWDMAVNRWTWPDPSVMGQIFRSPGHRETLPPNDTIDSLLDEADITLDWDRRSELVSEAQKQVLLDRMIVPLVTDYPMTVVNKALENYRFDYLGYIYGGDLKIAS